ncbi:unnamed protein product [Eruca vesicaria subsp. sativa]|uniref:Uncharacterized protein n=1 Tax=Eruca vesicaria subsp. sativa TaxID=29727 RepID=A0ABC8KBL4_ERUVS|nr:unnamed protein product [Eruca vesicaria subsp. sativa]
MEGEEPKVDAKEALNNLSLENSVVSDAPEEGEAIALTPAKHRGTQVLNLEKHLDENLVTGTACTTPIKKENLRKLAEAITKR